MMYRVLAAIWSPIDKMTHTTFLYVSHGRRIERPVHLNWGLQEILQFLEEARPFSTTWATRISRTRFDTLRWRLIDSRFLEGLTAALR